MDGSQVEYSAHDTEALERKHAEGSGGICDVRKGDNFVDLSRMVQVNKSTKVERPVERRADGRKFQRGKGFEYLRPCGWFRFGLNVKDKFGSNEWLGPSGDRESGDEKEWPVSYHGTANALAGAAAARDGGVKGEEGGGKVGVGWCSCDGFRLWGTQEITRMMNQAGGRGMELERVREVKSWVEGGGK